MELIYYKADKGNLGDDLNIWLWPKFFRNNDTEDNISFFGIGSILFNDFPLLNKIKDKRKIVFGTGVRFSNSTMKFDDTWDIKFLRGPISSLITNNKYKYITDSAYAIRLTDDYKKYINTPKKYEVSLLPYFKSLRYIDWEKICEKMNFNYISPECDRGIEFTLSEIAASKFLITEAMHGAILADALRVPWHRFIFSTIETEGQAVSEFKWLDWTSSIDLQSMNNTFIKFYRKSSINKIILDCTFDRVNVSFFAKNMVNDELINTLKNINEFVLSEDKKVMLIDELINEELYKLLEQIKKV